jgi:GAF domain-containing protein
MDEAASSSRNRDPLLTGEDGYRLAAKAFGDVAEAFAREEDIEELLRLIAQRAASLVGVSRCSIYLRREHSQLFKGKITYIDGADPDRAIRQLTAGVEADHFTREIVSTQLPVLVHDARTDPRVVRAAMRDWDVQAILGLPMIFADEVRGVMFLDNHDVAHDYTAEEQKIGAVFANLAAVAVVNAQRELSLRDATRAGAEQNKLLRRITVAADLLARRFASDASFGEIAALMADLAGKPCWFYGQGRRRIAASSLPGVGETDLRTPISDGAFDHPSVAELLNGEDGAEPVSIGPLAAAGLDRSFLVAPIVDDVEVSGYVVLAENDGRGINGFDRALARRAAGLSLGRVSAERRVAELRRVAAESLARDLVLDGADRESIDHRAAMLRIDLLREHLVVVLGTETSASPGMAEVIAAFVRELGAHPFVSCRVGGLEVSIVPCGAGLFDGFRLDHGRGVAEKIGDSLYRGEPYLGTIVSASGGPTNYALAYRAALALREAGKARGDGGTSGARVLVARDIDLGQVMRSGDVPIDCARKLAADTLGALTLEPSRSDLLRTLVAYLDASCNVRSAATELGVHHNTVRYRLSQIRELTGLQVATNTRDLLAAQLALTMLEMDEAGPVQADGAETPADQAP